MFERVVLGQSESFAVETQDSTEHSLWSKKAKNPKGPWSPEPHTRSGETHKEEENAEGKSEEQSACAALASPKAPATAAREMLERSSVQERVRKGIFHRYFRFKG